MSFTNFSIDISALPQQQELELTPVSVKFKIVQWWNWTIGWLIVLLIPGLIFFLAKEPLDTAVIVATLSGILLLAVLHKIVQLRAFPYRAFLLREKDLIYQQGWIIRKKEFCPLNRIQHCNIKVGIIERKLGLATLEIFTAGSSGADLVLRGLTQTQAVLLKEMVIQKTADEATV